MSQYAFGVLLRDLYRFSVYYDLSFFKGPFPNHVTPRSYELGEFPLLDIRTYNRRFYKSQKRLKRLARQLSGIDTFRTFEERIPFYPQKALESVKHATYFDGYWQSYAYIRPILDTLRKDFALPGETYSEGYLTLLKKIKRTDTPVSVHVRRGDYISNEAASQIHVVCSVDYYKRCIAALREYRPNARFFVFSDDISWAKENLNAEDTEFVDSTVNHFEDFELMRNCKHSILANSSFSYWAALLKENHGKDLVYAPNRWLHKQARHEKMHPNYWKFV